MTLPRDLRDALVGTWRGEYRLWFEPDVAAHQCPVTATFEPMLDDRFVVHRYEWSYDSTPQAEETKATEARYTRAS